MTAFFALGALFLLWGAACLLVPPRWMGLCHAGAGALGAYLAWCIA